VRAGRVVRATSRLRTWLPAILWAVLISVASTDAFSSSNTSRFILPILHWFFPHAGPDTLNRIQFFIRKLAHVTEYFVFSVILFRAIRSERQGERRGWRLRWALLALAIAAGYSALDEFHQSFVPSRTASPWDSLLDTSGAAAAQVITWAWIRLRDGEARDAQDQEDGLQDGRANGSGGGTGNKIVPD